MGMAASQARYLALVARKSNCEYEGQQINQARLNLSNQSANLFNQMLGLTVPVPPSTQDYTTTQYSYTDGVNSSVIDSWKQLSEADPEYNYIVKTHYFTDVYTGSLKKMTDPQVQMSNPAVPAATQVQIEAALANLRTAETEMNDKYNHWQSVKRTQEKIISNLRAEAREKNASTSINSDLAYANAAPVSSYKDTYTFAESAAIAHQVNVYNDPNDPNATAADKTAAHNILAEIERMIDVGIMSLDELNANIMAQDPTYYINDVSQIHHETGDPFTAKQLQVLETYGVLDVGSAALDANVPPNIINFVADSGANKAQYLVLTKNLADLATSIRTDGVTGAINGYPIDLGTSVSSDFKTSAEYQTEIQNAQDVIDAAQRAYYDDSVDPPTGAKVDYDEALAAYEALNQPSYIGNCELTYLDTLTDDQSTELLQVVKDMTAQDINTDILNCFDTNGNYLGGVYSFQLNGVTYYTTYDSLMDAYASNTQSNNFIDGQYKMPYYNASYVNTRIDQECKALLETDGNGRFTSVRFENDSVTYTLNMETVTDDKAYQDAMNRYYYENAKYDKMIQDINAKTSIIHQQDQELELRLKQLDTEQNALSTEIDAVSKVVKDNVESSFKTFGG